MIIQLKIAQENIQGIGDTKTQTFKRLALAYSITSFFPYVIVLLKHYR
jgi:hypothetical protein